MNFFKVLIWQKQQQNIYGTTDNEHYVYVCDQLELYIQ